MNLTDFAAHVQTHVVLAASALAVAIAAGVPLGALAASNPLARAPVLALANLGRVVPTLAVLTFVLPALGVGFLPALVALALLATAPVVINTDLGLRGVPEAAIDAARGMGMTPRQVFVRVRWPLALPVTLAGIRTGAIEVIASATLAAFIGAGGLGEYILQGLQSNDTQLLDLSAAAVAVLALATEGLFALAGRRAHSFEGTAA